MPNGSASSNGHAGPSLVKRNDNSRTWKSRSTDLVDFIAQGQESPAIATRLKEFEAKAVLVRRTVVDLERASSGPIALPSPEDMVRLTIALERRLTSDVTKGREELRRLFKDGRIELLPQDGGFYVAKSELLPLVRLTARVGRS